MLDEAPDSVVVAGTEIFANSDLGYPVLFHEEYQSLEVNTHSEFFCHLSQQVYVCKINHPVTQNVCCSAFPDFVPVEVSCFHSDLLWISSVYISVFMV